VIGYSIGATSRLQTRGEHPVAGHFSRDSRHPRLLPYREHRSTNYITYTAKLRQSGMSFKDRIPVGLGIWPGNSHLHEP
jgi:hypothetical protein